MKKNALHSLFGSKARAASAERVRAVLDERVGHMAATDELILELLEAVKPTKALAGTVGGQAREQTVLTPPWLWKQLGPIALDPCTAPDNPCEAEEFCALELGGNGLEESWNTSSPGCVYVNEPFNQLQAWLDKAKEEADAWEPLPILMLAPFRPNRTWFCQHAARADEVKTLRPFKFVGHTSAFPAPLCMIAWNTTVPDLVDEKGRSLITGTPFRRAA